MNRSVDNDWIDDKAGTTWKQMAAKDGSDNKVFSVTIEGLKQGDAVRYQFANATGPGQNYILSGSGDWKPASIVVADENLAINASAAGFPASMDTTVVFTVD